MILSGTLHAQTVQYSSEIKQQNCPQGYDVVNCTGTGTLEYPNGEKYIGQLNFGKPEGSGTLILKDGFRFVGTFRKGVGEQGLIFRANGSSLDSDEWPGSMFIRIPKHAIQKNVTTPIAELSNAQQIENQRLKIHPADALAVQPFKTQSSLPACPPSGYLSYCFGSYVYPSGNKYLGEFKADKRDGMGTFYDSNGSVIKQGIWSFDNFIRSAPVQQASVANQIVAGVTAQPNVSPSNRPACPSSGYLHNCFGTYTYPSGNMYIGEFFQDKRNGQGIFYSSSGSIISQGIWSYDNLVQAVPVQQATASLALSNNAERDRLTAEVEVERKKRQELEEQLRVAQQQSNKPIASYGIERRVALVIGNATYKVNPLKNPVNDSTDMARSLRSVGFDVIEANNTTLAQMREVTRRFADKLGNSDVGLVYYSGHGVEVKGKNYLIPVNADIKREYEVVDQAFDAGQFLEMMDNIRGPNNKRVNILIVDACRNNELQKSWRSTNNGLARMDAPGGTFISFATAPGRVAADGSGRNSPYTKHLLQALKQPNVPIEQVFKVVRRNVMEETKGEQIPWENSSLVGDFFFTVQR